MRKLQVRDFEIQKCEIMRDSFSFNFLIILLIFVAIVIGFIFVIFCPSAAVAKKCPLILRKVLINCYPYQMKNVHT